MADRAGARLRAAIASERVLSAGEETILAEACVTLDELVRMERALRRQAVTVLGSTGQPKPNPLFEEARRHRELLSKLLTVLKVESASAVSDLMQHVAIGRWTRDRSS